MLDKNEKEKIVEYIDKITNSINEDAKKSINDGMSYNQVIDKIMNSTVNRFTPESKMIMSSTYNMLMDKTLEKPFYEIAENKAAFYEMDILRELSSKFNFDIPAEIDFQSSKIELNHLIKSGIVIVVGGILSVSLDNWIPVGIAAVIVGIMVIMLRETPSKSDIEVSKIIENYLINVSKSLLLWVESIEKYYDSKVAIIEKKVER